MTYTYGLRFDIVTDEDGRPTPVYGITAFNHATMQIERSIPDVFFDRQEAEHFVSLCNRNGLSILHLQDVTEDQLV